MSAINRLIEKPAKWLSASGEEQEMVLSSRIRLARNLDSRPFTNNASPEELKEVKEEVEKAALKCPLMKEALNIDIAELDEIDRTILVERHLISHEMAQMHHPRSLVVQQDERLSVMINEEDHMRIQAIEPGLSVERAFKKIDKLDNELDKNLNYAFSEKFGYLTACPTNVGTGLRVSVMVHLPGLVHNKDIGRVIDGLRNMRLTVRGIYGEGSEFMGNLFQISNSITLGLSEKDTVSNLEAHVRKVLDFERKAREVLLNKARTLLEDKIWRAYGILKSARLLSSKEAMSLMSAVRLGIGLGMITNISLPVLNELLIMIRPMHLQKLHGRMMTPEERDRVRADFIRARLDKRSRKA